MKKLFVGLLALGSISANSADLYVNPGEFGTIEINCPKGEYGTIGFPGNIGDLEVRFKAQCIPKTCVAYSTIYVGKKWSSVRVDPMGIELSSTPMTTSEIDRLLASYVAQGICKKIRKDTSGRASL